MTEEPNYVVESVPTQRAFDWTSLVPAASVPQVSVPEVISVDAEDDLSSPSSAPGSPKGPGLGRISHVEIDSFGNLRRVHDQYRRADGPALRRAHGVFGARIAGSLQD